MSYTGTVKNGVVVLAPGVQLPDGTEVEVSVPDATDTQGTFADRYKKFIGVATDLPADLAANLDHYVHAQPKK